MASAKGPTNGSMIRGSPPSGSDFDRFTMAQRKRLLKPLVTSTLPLKSLLNSGGVIWARMLTWALLARSLLFPLVRTSSVCESQALRSKGDNVLPSRRIAVMGLANSVSMQSSRFCDGKARGSASASSLTRSTRPSPDDRPYPMASLAHSGSALAMSGWTTPQLWPLAEAVSPTMPALMLQAIP